MTEIFADADGVKLYCEDTGSGYPIVFVHEFAGDTRSWEPQVRYFSRRYRCITYNARGYPPSDVPEGLVHEGVALTDEHGAGGPAGAAEPETALEILPEGEDTTLEEESDAVAVLAEESGKEEISIAVTAPDLGGDDASAGEFFEAPGADLSGPDPDAGPDPSEDGQKG